MGTRNITRIICEGNCILSQFGMYDGTPAFGGKVVRNSLARLGAEKIKNIFSNTFTCQINDTNILGDYDNAEFKEIYDFINSVKNKSKNSPQIIDIVKKTVKKYGWEATEKYFMKSDETGYNVIDAMDALRQIDSEKPIHIYLAHETFDTDGIFVIDLDKKCFSIQYYNISMTYSFDELPSDNILQSFEEMAEELVNDYYEEPFYG